LGVANDVGAENNGRSEYHRPVVLVTLGNAEEQCSPQFPRWQANYYTAIRAPTQGFNFCGVATVYARHGNGYTVATCTMAGTLRPQNINTRASRTAGKVLINGTRKGFVYDKPTDRHNGLNAIDDDDDDDDVENDFLTMHST
jgi:hypothetical protein